MTQNNVASGGAILGAYSGLGAGWYALRSGAVSEGAFSMKPLRMKTSLLLTVTTFTGYFAGKLLFGAMAPVKK